MADTVPISIDPEDISASELRHLPLAERAAILESQAALAEEFYRQGSDLLGFEAFVEELKDGDAPSAQEG